MTDECFLRKQSRTSELIRAILYHVVVFLDSGISDADDTFFHFSRYTQKMAAPPYQLAFSLHGHASDVRHLCCPSSGIPLLLSASRDGSGIVWGPSSKGKEWDVKMRVEVPENKYISCVGMVRWEGEGRLSKA